MGEAKHTPGPWEVVDRHLSPRYVVKPDDGVDVISGWTMICQPEESRDCDLIAAAPELLEALEHICAEAESWHKETGHEDDDPIIKCDGICACIPQMRAAIRKAKGER
jgi:hypothetical protein